VFAFTLGFIFLYVSCVFFLLLVSLIEQKLYIYIYIYIYIYMVA